MNQRRIPAVYMRARHEPLPRVSTTKDLPHAGHRARPTFLLAALGSPRSLWSQLNGIGGGI